MKKTEKKYNNKNCIFCLKPYVRNGLFERKIILVRHLFSKKQLYRKFCSKNFKNRKKEKQKNKKQHKLHFLLKTLCKKRHF